MKRNFRFKALGLSLGMVVVLVILAGGVLSSCNILTMFNPADTIYVRAWASDNNNGKHPSTAVGSLAEAVRKVDAGGTIKMGQGDYLVTDYAFINKPVVIEGGYDENYTVVIGKSNIGASNYYGTVVFINGQGVGNKVSMSNIIIRSAYSAVADGSAINISNNADAILSSCEFIGNVNLGKAAAISVHESILQCVGCKFLGNSTIYDPAAVMLNNSPAVFDGCIFTHNGKRNIAGGQVLAQLTDTAQNVSFMNCAFSDNGATRAFYTKGGVMVDLGGNVGMLPPVADVVAAFTGWTTGVAAATTVKSGPTPVGSVTTMVMANPGETVTITMATDTAAGTGAYTYKFVNYINGSVTYNGTITAATTGYPAITKFVYSGTLTMTGAEIQKIEYDYTLEGTTFSGTINIDDVYVYDMADLGL